MKDYIYLLGGARKVKIEITERDQDILSISLEGRLDTMTAPELEKVLEKELPGMKKLVLDFTDLEYISSAGLRVILGAYQALGESEGVTVRNANEYVLETFEMTGFLDFLNIE